MYKNKTVRYLVKTKKDATMFFLPEAQITCDFVSADEEYEISEFKVPEWYISAFEQILNSDNDVVEFSN